jgi:branched-chain amino acid transport system permease protein
MRHPLGVLGCALSVREWMRDSRVRRYANWLAALLAAYAVMHRLWPAPGGVIAQGVVVGSVGSLLALGLALIYRANRIVNFAQADLGLVPSTTAILLISQSKWPFVPTFALGLIGALVMGALVHKVFIQRFSRATRLILTVVTIGVSQILLAVATFIPNWLYGNDAQINAQMPVLFKLNLTIRPIVFSGNDFLAIFIVPVCIIVLLLFLRYTSIGVAIRGSAESADRAALLGVPVARIQTFVWMAAAVLSFVGVFLRASSFAFPGSGSAGAGPFILAQALAAAVIGRMERFGSIVAASIGLGILQQSVIWHSGRSLDTNLVMFVVVIGALLFQHRRQSRVEDGEVSTWRTMATIRPIPTELRLLPEVRRAVTGVRWLLVAIAAGAPLVLNAGRTSLVALVFVYALLGLSIVVLTGFAGLVSLGQAAFFGLGGAIGGALTLRNWDLGAALLFGGLAGAVAAILVGLPALRIKGLYLAVTTLAFAVFMSTYVINPDVLHWVPRADDFIPRRALFGRIDLTSERAYYYLCLACLGAGIAIVHGIRNSRTGRALIGVRDNERAAQSYGVNPIRAKLTAFATAGFLAAVAGVLYVHSQQALGTARFSPGESLRVFTMVVIGGAGSISGAIVGSLYLNGTLWFTDLLPNQATVRSMVSFLGTGVGVIVILWLLPEGLGSLLYRGRDRLLRVVAARRSLIVPSLIADRAAASLVEPVLPPEVTSGVPPLIVDVVSLNPELAEVGTRDSDR